MPGTANGDWYEEGCGCLSCSNARERQERARHWQELSQREQRARRERARLEGSFLAAQLLPEWVVPVDDDVSVPERTWLVEDQDETPVPNPDTVVICGFCYRDAVAETNGQPRCTRHVGMETCLYCGGLHYTQRGEEPCVLCNVCPTGRREGYHQGPVCCAPVPEGMVHCESCNGLHESPVCGARDVSYPDRCWRCTSCETLRRTYDQRSRFRSYSLDDAPVGTGRIFNYSFTPQPLVFRGDGPFYYGMELELEVNDLRTNVSDAAELATESLGQLGYLKEDGSIDYGFEIVSTPMSYQFFTENYPWDMLSQLREQGCRTNRGTGIHVHVSKAGFTPAHAYKWMKFWYRNQGPLEVFARRGGSRWAEFSQDERHRVKHYCKGDMRTGPRGQSNYYGPIRYSAINVLPPNTYEVRVFRSSLSPRVARATLGLVAATVDYTRDITPRDITQHGAWDWGQFTKWVRKQGGKYPDLLAEMTRATQRLEQQQQSTSIR